ncbi:MAG: flavodoxin domain-containing protein [Pseudomonadota bacterium]
MAAILIVFSTREGQTKRIAERIARELGDLGHTTMLRKAGHGDRIRKPDAFDAVIVAASVHAGKHGRDVRGFVARHLAILDKKPSAFLSVSLSAAASTIEGRTAARTQAEQFLATVRWAPDLLELTAGALRYSRFSRPWRWVLRFAQRRFAQDLARSGWPELTQDKEYTDWERLGVFVRRFDDLVVGRVRSEDKHTAQGLPA